MGNVIINISRLLLLFFAVYAFSPIYATFSVSNDMPTRQAHGSTPYTVGILWIGIMLDDVLGSNGPGGMQELSPSGDDDDFIFIKKKRTITRKRSPLKPMVQIGGLAVTPEPDSAVGQNPYDVPCDLLHNQQDSYYSRSTGLSPPFFFS